MEHFHCQEGFVEMMMTESKLLNHANEVYTLGAYRLFEEQFMKFPEYCQELMVCNEGEHVYEVWRPDIIAFRYTVFYSVSTLNISYTYKMFNKVGILCPHCLRIFNIFCVQAIPDKYILKRWTKDIDLSLGSSSVGDIGKVSNNDISGYSAWRREMLRKF
ncbi:hypothetical protein M9H77_21508 [Catharanthus roseus]|uniref:Uncharacterized protein n=1 Tax=Catharanthus roseus TaxID=4058 RepID=A0ACC0AMS4_CATRO|nr:hypothetical protein M9H77_21508 [Catharanthus roseus]